MSKIGCVNYARFPKSGHLYIALMYLMQNPESYKQHW